MLLRVDGSAMLVRAEQLWNARLPIDVNPSGRLITESFEHPAKALSPISVTASERLTLSSFVAK